MFRSLQDVLSYYKDELTDELENEYYDADVFRFVDTFNENKKLHYYFWEDNKLMQDCIQNAKTRLQEMLQDGKAAQDDDAIESAVKEQWEDNANGEQDDYPDWDDYKDSKNYYKEAEFISGVLWQDFEDNYEDEMQYFKSYRDWRDLSSQIDRLDDEIDEMKKRIPEIMLNIKRKTIGDIFEE